MMKKIANLIKDGHFMELLKGGGVSLVVKVIGMLSGFVFQWIITTYYGVGQLGLLLSSISVLSIMLLIGKLGLDASFLRFVAEHKVKKEFNTIVQIRSKSLWVIVPMAVLVNAALYMLSGLIANSVFNRPDLEEPIRLISFAILPMALYQFNGEGLRGLKRIKEFALVTSAGRFLFGILAFVIAYFFFATDLPPSVLFVIGCAVTSIFSFWLWRKSFASIRAKNKESSVGEDVPYNSIFNLALPLLLASSTAFLMNWTDTLILTYFRSSEEVAVYNVALKFAAVSKLVLIAINSIAAPKFAEFYGSGDNEGLGKMVRQSTKLIFWASIPLLVVFIAFPTFFLGLYGEEYLVGALSLSILAGAQFFSAISGSVGNLLQMTGRQKVYRNIILVSTIFNISLNIVLIPAYGIVGAAITGFITIIARNTFSIIYIYRNYGFLTLYIPLIAK
ncbi:MAG: O-antigen/teichoic acid export membrane protein [Bacteroidia bacterium]|jgi:O-antigen/teichoic acid export membrane protein